MDLKVIQTKDKREVLEYVGFLIAMFKNEKDISLLEGKLYKKTPLIFEFVNSNDSAEFYTRCKTILSYDMSKKRNLSIFLKFFILIICTIMMLTLVFQPEYDIPEEQGLFELTEDNAYLKQTKSGYDIYHNAEFIYSIDDDLSGYEHLPIKK